MKNLLNTISAGKYDNLELLEIKLNNTVLWSSVYNKFLLRYRVKQDGNYNLSSKIGDYYYARPMFTLEDDTVTTLDESTTIYLHDGSTTNDLNTLLNNIDLIEIEYNENVRKISFENSLLVTDVAIGRTDKLNDMSNMFRGCLFLKHLNVPRWDTSSVTNMAHMFDGCRILTGIDVSRWVTDNVTDMSYLFNGCRLIKSLELSNWNTDNVTDMAHMFHSCRSLKDLFISNFNIDKVTNIEQIFRDCSSLERLDISKWRIYNVSKKAHILRHTISLKEIRYGLVTANDINYVVSCLEPRTSDSYGEMYYSLKDNSEIDTINYSEAKSKYWNLYRFCIIFRRAEEGHNYFYTNEISRTVSKYAYDNDSYIYRTDDNVESFSFWSGESNSNLLSVDVLINSTVKDLKQTFRGCSSLIKTNFSNFNTSNVTDMGYMFYDCLSLVSLDLPNINTSSLKYASYMFGNCKLLTSLDLSNFDTKYVFEIDGLFNGCESLTSLDLSKFDTDNITDMSYMFNGCKSLTELDVSSFKTDNITSISYMFANCDLLANISGIYGWDTSKVKNMSYMFSGCTSLSSLDLSNFNTDNVLNMASMFNECTSLKFLDLYAFNTRKVVSISNMFNNVPTDIDWNYEHYLHNYEDFIHTEWCTNYSGIFPWDEIKLLAQFTCINSIVDPVFNSEVEYYRYTRKNDDGTYSAKLITKYLAIPSKISFKDNTNLVSLEYINTSEVGNMSGMLSGCTSLNTINMSYNDISWNNNWNTGTANNMSYLFNNCTSLTELILTNWDTYEVTDVSGMCANCTSLTSVRGIENWNTRNLKTMYGMFSNCASLEYVSFFNYDTEGNFISVETDKLTNTSYMFAGCDSLRQLDLSVFNTSNVTSMDYMFYECSSMYLLNLETWDTNKVDKRDYMFSNVPDNAVINVTEDSFTLTEDETSFGGTFKRIQREEI